MREIFLRLGGIRSRKDTAAKKAARRSIVKQEAREVLHYLQYLSSARHFIESVNLRKQVTPIISPPKL